jgi:hypothetical protein
MQWRDLLDLESNSVTASLDKMREVLGSISAQNAFGVSELNSLVTR